MARREIIRMGDSRLLRVAQPVEAFDTDELHQLVADMWETMDAEGGVGLAAPQIAVDLQLMVFGTARPSARYPQEEAIGRTVLLNPAIEPLSREQAEDWEGCLSIPGLRGRVPRWTHIRYRGFDPWGALIEREARGFHARVVQHEFDHLMGTLYPMRMSDMRQFGYTDVLFPELAK